MWNHLFIYFINICKRQPCVPSSPRIATQNTPCSPNSKSRSPKILSIRSSPNLTQGAPNLCTSSTSTFQQIWLHKRRQLLLMSFRAIVLLIWLLPYLLRSGRKIFRSCLNRLGILLADLSLDSLQQIQQYMYYSKFESIYAFIKHKMYLLNQFVCSERFIVKCLDLFKPMSEELALKRLRQGLKPDSEQKKPSQTQSTSSKKKQPAKKGGAGKKRRDEQLDDEGNAEESKEVQVISEAEIREKLSKSDEMMELKDEGLLEGLVEFLVGPVNKQFQGIFLEAFARQSTKSQASNNKNLEQDVEDSFHQLQYIHKQLETLKKQSEANLDAVLTPVQAHLAKNDCQILLNKLVMVQAFYNSVNFSNIIGLSLDPKTKAPIVNSLNDRKLVQNVKIFGNFLIFHYYFIPIVQKQFQKHINQIFDDLNHAVSDRDLPLFLSTLSDNVKNMGGVRVKLFDKKVERKVKDTLSATLKEILVALDNPLSDYRSLLSGILALKMHEEHTLYLGLPNEEWAIKISVNLLTNHLGKQERLKDKLVKAQNLYGLYGAAGKNAESPEAVQIKQEGGLAKHVEQLREILAYKGDAQEEKQDEQE